MGMLVSVGSKSRWSWRWAPPDGRQVALLLASIAEDDRLPDVALVLDDRAHRATLGDPGVCHP
jgi:hypothetical protein